MINVVSFLYGIFCCDFVTRTAADAKTQPWFKTFDRRLYDVPTVFASAS